MLIINTMAHRSSIMDLIDVNVPEISELSYFILLTYSAVKMTAASMKNLDAVK